MSGPAYLEDDARMVFVRLVEGLSMDGQTSKVLGTGHGDPVLLALLADCPAGVFVDVQQGRRFVSFLIVNDARVLPCMDNMGNIVPARAAWVRNGLEIAFHPERSRVLTQTCNGWMCDIARQLDIKPRRARWFG